MSRRLNLARAGIALTLLAAGAVASGCAALWGFQDTVDASAQDGSGDGTTAERADHDAGTDARRDSRPDVQDGSTEDSYDAPTITDALPLSDAPVTDPCNPTALETFAFYVAAHDGVDDSACGPKTAPCKSIHKAIAQAGATVSIINVAQGTYDEDPLVLKQDLTIVGGWLENKGAWARDPSVLANADAVIKPSTSAVGVQANALGSKPTTLCTLTVQSKDTAAAGETLYGVFATGSTNLILKDVVVNVAAGGDGIAGKVGKDGDAGSEAGCGASGGSGGSGAEAGAPGKPAVAGSFGSSGYVTGDGTDGGPGEPGQNGSVGGAGSCISYVTSCTPLTGLLCQAYHGSECGADGGAGCGGGSGGPGTGGGGGGSSVGVFVYSATVAISGSSKIATGAGGDGADGGAGGKGGPGGKGATGVAGAPVPTKCPNKHPCTATTDVSPLGGTPGMRGGDGTPGGLGGGGSGGWSCPVAQGGGSTVTLKPSVALTPGKPGAGAGGAPSGGIGDDAGVCSF